MTVAECQLVLTPAWQYWPKEETLAEHWDTGKIGIVIRGEFLRIPQDSDPNPQYGTDLFDNLLAMGDVFCRLHDTDCAEVCLVDEPVSLIYHQHGDCLGLSLQALKQQSPEKEVMVAAFAQALSDTLHRYRQDLLRHFPFSAKACEKLDAMAAKVLKKADKSL